MKKIHTKSHVDFSRDPLGERIYLCGFRQAISAQQPYAEDAVLCQRCDDIRANREIKEEQEAERLTAAGFLEEDGGRNRQYNEY